MIDPVRLGEVDWARVAEPQQDGYDSGVALALAEREWGWRAPAPPEPPNAFDGRVALRTWRASEPISMALSPGNLGHPNLPRAEACVRRVWPAAHDQFARLVAELAPMNPCEQGRSGRIGSISGHSAALPFAVYTTCFDAFGTAESLVHEMAHLKLHCLGVQVESSLRLILNAPSERYRSPLRSHPRPMTALVHAFYSWLHITELDVRWAEVEAWRALMRLERNCLWIRAMAQEIVTHARTDEAGRLFLAKCFAWGGRLVLRGRALLDSAKAPAPEGA